MRKCIDSIEGTFIRRLNRFVAEVELGGETELVHVPNTGRMRELLQEGHRVILRPAPGDARKTRYDLWAARCGDVWVCIDSRAANDVAWELLARLTGAGEGFSTVAESALYRGLRPLVSGITSVQREVRFGERRFDFAVQKGGKTVPVEVKSVNLVHDGVAMFPDAPTARGAHHVRRLGAWAKAGNEGHILFVVQRSDAALFRPHWSMDLEFSEGLAEAHASGVGVYAVGCDVSRSGIAATKLLSVDLNR